MTPTGSRSWPTDGSSSSARTTSCSRRRRVREPVGVVAQRPRRRHAPRAVTRARDARPGRRRTVRLPHRPRARPRRCRARRTADEATVRSQRRSGPAPARPSPRPSLDLHGTARVDARRDPATTLDALARSTSTYRGTDVPAGPRTAPSRCARRCSSPRTWRSSGVASRRRAQPLPHDRRAPTLLASTLRAPGHEDAAAAPVGGSDGRRVAHGPPPARPPPPAARALGVAAPSAPLAGVVDRSCDAVVARARRGLDDRGPPLAQYDARFAERVALLEQLEARNIDPSLAPSGFAVVAPRMRDLSVRGPLPRRALPDDDVSLVRFTERARSAAPPDHGIATRRRARRTRPRRRRAGLGDPRRAERSRRRPSASPWAAGCGRRPARAARTCRGRRHAPPPRARRPARRAPRATSRSTSTWRATTTRPTCGARSSRARPDRRASTRATAPSPSGARSTERSEGELFASFFAWLAATVAAARGRGARPSGSTASRSTPSSPRCAGRWRSASPGLPPPASSTMCCSRPLVDLHRVVTTQIQTAGPAGLKVIATAAGFAWRDDAPCGEASMVVVRDGERRPTSPRRERGDANGSSSTTRTTVARRAPCATGSRVAGSRAVRPRRGPTRGLVGSRPRGVAASARDDAPRRAARMANPPAAR